MHLWKALKSALAKKHKVTFTPETSTLSESGYQHPLPAREYIPVWYKKMPRQIPGKPAISQEMYSPSITMKACTPLLDAFSMGYIQELTCDVEVDISNDGEPYFFWQKEQPWQPVRGRRDPATMVGVPTPAGHVAGPFLWVQPFEFNLPDGWSMLITHPLNREELPFRTMSAVVDSDKMPMRSEIAFYIKEGFKGTIPKGTPIFQVIPVKREKWESSVAPFSESHRTKFINLTRNVWGGAYRDNFWVKKEYEAPKCPVPHVGVDKNER